MEPGNEKEKTPNGKDVRLGDIERIIHQLRDVISARIVLNGEGMIEEIHVVSKSERNPKQIVRDIESALMAQLGIQVDHKKISIAQMEEELPTIHPELRVKFVNLQFLVSGTRAEVKVELAKNNLIYCGQASGSNTSHNQLRLIATATVEALNEFILDSCSLAIEDVHYLSLGGKEAIVVLISLLQPQKEESLIGSSVVKHGIQEAVVSATLDAINRSLGSLISTKVKRP